VLSAGIWWTGAPQRPAMTASDPCHAEGSLLHTAAGVVQLVRAGQCITLELTACASRLSVLKQQRLSRL